VTQDRDVIFVGRLVSDKGADLLLEALSVLKKTGFTPGLTITGEGPEESPLRLLVEQRGLTRQVTFTGMRSGADLSRLMAAHRVLVAPSRCNEGFGMVALEGAASGCVVIGSEGGGLVDAIGPCGFVVPKEDVQALAMAIQKTLASPSASADGEAACVLHLARHAPSRVSEAYLHTLKMAVRVA
jgi:glycosyltransferase involved in cell wall biosynthesis